MQPPRPSLVGAGPQIGCRGPSSNKPPSSLLLFPKGSKHLKGGWWWEGWLRGQKGWGARAFFLPGAEVATDLCSWKRGNCSPRCRLKALGPGPQGPQPSLGSPPLPTRVPVPSSCFLSSRSIQVSAGRRPSRGVTANYMLMRAGTISLPLIRQSMHCR